MTIKELYEWAKERNLLDKQIAKHFQFNLENIECVSFLPQEITKTEDLVVLD